MNINALGSEAGVLGLLMIYEDNAPDVFRALNPEMFYSDNNRKFFSHIKDMSATGAKLDYISVAQSLRSAGIIGELGGTAYLTELTTSCVPVENLDYHLSQIRSAWFGRKMVECATRLAADPDQERHLTELQRYALGRDAESAPPYFDFSKDLPRHIDTLEPSKTGDGVIDTGFKSLDIALQGLRTGDLMTISARPGGGKTAIMTKMAVSMAERGLTVGYLSTEMTTEQFVNRVLPFKSRVESWRFRKRQLRDCDRRSVSEVCGEMHGKTRLVVSDASRPSLADIRSMVVRVKPQVIVIDYLQRCQRPRAENFTRQVDEFMAALKSMAKDHKLVVILGCQMNRGVDRSKGEPTLSDLRDSGSIESESDQVLLLWSPDGQNDESAHKVISGMLEKNRHGGQAQVSFLLEKSFVDMTETTEAR